MRHILTKANFEAFEMQIAHHIANENKVPTDTEDIHTCNARMLFGVKEVTPELRQKAKELMFYHHYCGNQTTMVKEDVYILIASKIFDVPKENITPAMRQAAKRKVYRMIYS